MAAASLGTQPALSWDAVTGVQPSAVAVILAEVPQNLH